MKKKTLSFLATILLSLSFIGIAQAGFSMVPGGTDANARRQFNYEMKPGDSTSDSIVIVNNSATPITLLLYGADATHSNQGSFALVNRNATQRTVGNWVKFTDSTVTLQGGEKKEIPFQITLPSDVTPGTYAGGIAAETTTVQNQTSASGTANTGAGVIISSRLVIKLFIDVPGQKTVKYSWTDFSQNAIYNQKHRFSLTYGNQGNAAIAVDPKIDITNLLTNSSEEITIPETTLLQNENITIPYDWDQTPLFGIYKATATTVFSEYDIANNQNINPVTQVKTLTFWIIPWNIAAIILAVIALIFIYIIYRLALMHGLRKRAADYVVADGETLISIAQKAKIKWRNLAKLNKLKPPYTVKKGDHLQVPFKK